MKKYLFGFIGIVAAVAAFASVPPGTCGGDDVNPRTRLVTNAWENAKGDIMAAMTDGEARPLPRYLHALTFFDAYPAEAAAYYATLAEVGGGCSAVRDGNTFARNFDFPFDDRAEFVITMQPGAGRFASVGVANVGTNLTEAMVNSGKHSAYYKCLPGATTDGVNENGVAACINVVSSFGHTNGWHGATVHYLAAVRRVLDTATNAADAAADLAANVYVPQSALDRGYSFHYIVADSTATYIVEDGEARPYTGRVVMTNYRLFDPGEPYGTGRERAALLANPDADITEAWFTLAYEADTRPIRYSEFVAPGKNPTNEYDNAVASWANGLRETHRGKGFWQSVHTSIYDLENLTLKIAVQEIPDFYTFAIPQGGKVKSVNGKTGDVTITAQDVNAWDLSRDQNATTNEMNYLYFKGRNGSNLGYFQFGQDYNGTEIGLVDWNNPGGGQRYMFINLTGIQVYDGEVERGFIWDDLITLDDVKSQYYPSSALADYPISSKGVNDFAQHTFLTQLDNRFLKSADAQTTYLSKTDAQNTYSKIEDTYTKFEIDDTFLTKTSTVKRVYAESETQYIDGGGRVYELSQGAKYWDVLEDFSQKHWIFEQIGDEWHCMGFVVPNIDTYLRYNKNSPNNEKWELYDGYYEVYGIFYGEENATTLELMPFGTATAKYHDPVFRHTKNIAYDNDVTNYVPRTFTINNTPLSGDGMTIDLTGYVPTSRKVNGQTLTNDITIVIPDAPADYETVSNRAMTAIQPWQMSHTNQTFASEVLSVGFSWDITSVTNAMAIINDFKEAFSGLDGTDIIGGATTIGTILLALIGAVTWLKKNKFDTSRVSASDDTFAEAVEDVAGRKVNIGVTASTHDGVVVTGQTVFVHNGTDASAPIIAAVAYNGTPITIKVDSGIQYFIRISDSLPMHFNPTTATGFATADTSITLTYSDATTVVDLNDIAPALAAINNLAQARELLVGKEFSDVWVDYDGTGNGDATPAQIDNKPAWNDPLVITDIQMVEDANGGTHLGAVLMRKFATRYDIVFDAPNQEEATEETAQAGVYYYGLAIGQTAVNPTNLTLLELSEGDEIPYSSYSKIFKNAYRDTSKYLQQYGHNRYETSAYRQYLNSSAAKDGWWTKQHIGQSKPSSASNYSGYMRGCSSKLLSLIKPVKRRLVPNYICDGGSSSDQGVGLYTVCDKFFLPCIGEMFGTDNNNEVYFNNEYNYQYTYWRGLAKDDEMSPSNNRNDINAIRPVKRINSKTGNPVNARLRSAFRGYSYYAWYLVTGGSLYYNNASGALASVPACVIY